MPRFASEYGFQAFPGFEVMSNYSLPQDRNFYSEYVDHIQHHGDGNAQLKSQLSTKVRLRFSGLGFHILPHIDGVGISSFQHKVSAMCRIIRFEG